MKYKNKNNRMIARFRVGNEYWRPEEEKKCRISEADEETIEHLTRYCEEWLRRTSAQHLSNEQQPDVPWMRKVKKVQM